jgi:cytochrome c-type biogenesis protein CcmH/NrfG
MIRILLAVSLIFLGLTWLAKHPALSDESQTYRECLRERLAEVSSDAEAAEIQAGCQALREAEYHFERARLEAARVAVEKLGRCYTLARTTADYSACSRN